MKHVAWAAALVLAGAPAFAENAFLLRGGINVAGASFDPSPPSDIDVGSRFGGEYGALLDMPFSGNMHMILGLLYENKGHTIAENYYGNDEEAIYKLDYMTIPYMLSFRSAPGAPGAGGKAGGNFFLNVGAEFSFLMGAEVEFDGDAQDFGNFVSGTDFGLRVETGVEIPMASPGRSFVVGLGYSRGMMNFIDAEYTDAEGKNYAFKLFAALKFGFAPSAATAPAAPVSDPELGFP